MNNNRVARSTGTGALSMSLTPTRTFKLTEIRVHLNAVGGAGTLTVTINDNAGAVYDTVLVSQDMTSVTDIVYQPDIGHFCVAGDSIDIVWANAGGKTYGVTIIYEDLEA